jgi:hypothetical protein
MQLLGVGEYAARLPNAICGMLSLVVLFRIGSQVASPRFGLLWAGAYFGSVLPFLYFKSGIIDPWFNLFIFVGLYYFIRFYWQSGRFERRPAISHPWKLLLAAGIFVGLGMLTKGPVALLIVLLTMGVYWVLQRFRWYVKPLHFLSFGFTALVVMVLWLGTETLLNGPWFVEEFTRYQIRLFSTHDAGHKGFPGYHVVVLLVGVFPASIFAVRSFLKMPPEPSRQLHDLRRWMSVLFWVVLVLFSVVQSKIVHYSSLCYFPLTFLAAYTLDKLMDGKIRFGGSLMAGLWIVGGLFVLFTILLPIAGQNIELLEPLFAKDPFAKANLDAVVNWTGWEVLPGLVLLAVLATATYFLRRAEWQRGLGVLFGGTALFCMLTLIFIAGRIEGYSQRAAIEFCKERQGEDCYVMTHGYKSYAQLFYTRKQPPADTMQFDHEWLLHGSVDKPVYVLTKINKAQEIRDNPNFTEIGAKNGFVFFKREKSNPR